VGYILAAVTCHAPRYGRLGRALTSSVFNFVLLLALSLDFR
jgi:hypothetical protein